MATSEVLQIFPTIETLCESTKGRPKYSVKNVKKFYHCPITTCKYFKNEFYFEKIKFLKQHFVKVHKPKSFLCFKCGKNFPLEATLNRHKLICGVTYRCPCKAEYKAYEALLTHVKRKHQGTTLKYKDMMECLKVHSTARDFQKQFDNSVKIKAIFVENPSKEKIVYVKPMQTSSATSKETQTGMKMCKILPNVSSETQTSDQLRKTVSMQTSVDCTGRRKKRGRTNENYFNQANSLISSGTQTSPMKGQLCVVQNSTEQDIVEESIKLDDTSECSNSTSLLLSSNMLLCTDDPNLGSISEEGTCSTGTQTNYSDDHHYGYDLLKTDSNLIMCSDSETQTVFEDIFDSSFIDTYTQTCDSLFSNLDFVDIETQTSWSVFDDKIS